MKLQYKTALAIFTVGVTALIITSAVYDYNAHRVSIKENLLRTRSIAVEVAEHIDTHLQDRASISLTLASAPTIKEALIQSNREFERLSDEKRQRTINDLNSQWMEAETPGAPFIQRHMTNRVAMHLKNQQRLFPGTYGEIFLTNRYGVMIATTGKLTTLAHGHKYWWTTAHDRGRGRVFLDDRGFDASVQGYVLGIVVPIYLKREIIGILKCNINIMGPLHHIVENFTQVTNGELKIARTGGTIVIERDAPPLSTQLP